MYGMLVSLGVMTWIVVGAQLAMYNKELAFVKKEVSITGCPVNITFRNDTDYSGLVRRVQYYTKIVLHSHTYYTYYEIYTNSAVHVQIT